jgi:predicted nucleic acid-binding protein
MRSIVARTVSANRRMGATGFTVFAYVSADDKDHVRVNEVLGAHRGQWLADILLTTNHVVAETITLVNKRGHRDPGVRHDLAVTIGRHPRNLGGG